MASKKAENDEGLDPINTALFNEVQRRAKQFFIDASINILFYDLDDGDKVLSHYQRLSQKERVMVLESLTDEGTLVAVHKTLSGSTETLDIILAARQGIESVMFESLRALVWYKWYWPIESRESKELGYITDDPMIHNMVGSHIAETVNQSLETLAVFIVGLIQSAELGSNPSAPDKETCNSPQDGL
ncbi:MAG TPA: hypothetical protein PK547_01695 [Candidatus Paceibacterota bacterium]|nr:hypothetical protein [Candidatus Paceibacterota bacterium]